MFGIESGSQRVLDRLKKEQTLGEVEAGVCTTEIRPARRVVKSRLIASAHTPGSGGPTAPFCWFVLLNQLRVVDKHRLGRRLGTLRPATMALVNDAIAIVLALVDI